MPYYLVDDFSRGMDLRRSSVTSQGETLRLISNAFVNKGGEIEKRKKWHKLTEISAVTTTGGPSSGNKYACHGPIPTFGKDAMFFSLSEGVGPLSSPWSTEGGGKKVTEGRFEIGVFEASGGGYSTEALLTSVMFVDELLISYGETLYLGDPFSVEHKFFSFTAGEIVPASVTSIAGRSANTGGTGTAVTQMVGRFRSMIAVSPPNYLMLKSETGAPESDAGTGAGSIELRGQGVEIGRPVAIEHYYRQVAIFGERGIQFWSVDTDPSNFSYERGIAGEVLVGSRTPLPYADGDILYLTDFGIRSLRARDSSNFAVTTDLGAPIDAAVVEQVDQAKTYKGMAISVVHEELGQAWFLVNRKAFVLSRYSSASVLAWSEYDLPDPDPALVEGLLSSGGRDYDGVAFDACQVGNTVCLRLGTSEVFVYGDEDLDGDHYDTAEATVITHYLDFGDPASQKSFTALDVACSGTWTIEFSIDPNNEQWVEIATVTDNTHLSGAVRFDARSTHIALRFKTTADSAAVLSHFGIHYVGEGERT